MDKYREKELYARGVIGQSDAANQHVRQTDINAAFTLSLAQHNYQRVIRIFESSPYYQSFKYAILGAVSHCGFTNNSDVPWSLFDFYPREMHSELENTAIPNRQFPPIW
ncbi:MAG: hypothetical protein R2827_06990 [Bdellovibrionales bacterium]